MNLKNDSRLKIHLIQSSAKISDPFIIFKKLSSQIEELQPQARDWILLPEMWAGSFQRENRIHYYKLYQEVEKEMAKLALKKQIYILGSALYREEKKYFNTIQVFNPKGQIQNLYHKIHLFKPLNEHLKFNVGHHISLAQHGSQRFGLGICFDLRFAEMWRLYALQKASLMIVPSAWPKERLNHFLTLLRARAIENQCFVVGINKVDTSPRGVVYGGHSAVFNPWGEEILNLKTSHSAHSIEINLEDSSTLKTKYPFFNERREDVYMKEKIYKWKI